MALCCCSCQLEVPRVAHTEPDLGEPQALSWPHDAVTEALVLSKARELTPRVTWGHAGHNSWYSGKRVEFRRLFRRIWGTWQKKMLKLVPSWPGKESQHYPATTCSIWKPAWPFAWPIPANLWAFENYTEACQPHLRVWAQDIAQNLWDRFILAPPVGSWLQAGGQMSQGLRLDI